MRIFMFKFLMTLSFAFVCATAWAKTAEEDLSVDKAVAIETAPGQMMGAVYFELMNKGSEKHSLIAVVSNIAETVQIHEMQMVKAQHQMRPLDEVEILPGATQIFQQGGTHIMLVNLKHPLKAGETLPMTLMFEDGTQLELKLPVQKR